ncbi:MAG: acetyl-CoA carboxylase, carboxyltransferase subunit beta [Culicoidibacterales bacterium]
MLTLFQLNKAKRPPKTQTPVKEAPNDSYTSCKNCGQLTYIESIQANDYLCANCGAQYQISARDRIDWLTDSGTFKEFNKKMLVQNPLKFPGYEQKLAALRKSTGNDEAVMTGFCQIRGKDCVIVVMDSHFLMGSMGSVVGEKIAQAISIATKKELSLIIFSASGGARMQEGIHSLMQMAKTSSLLKKHHEAGLLYISVLTNPTMGGVTASFASLGDIILAEPQALIGFAGARVIEQTIHQQLPEGFQRAEFQQTCGFVDAIVTRPKMRKTLAKLLSWHEEG